MGSSHLGEDSPDDHEYHDFHDDEKFKILMVVGSSNTTKETIPQRKKHSTYTVYTTLPNRTRFLD